MKVKYIPQSKLYNEYYCQRGNGGYFSGLPMQKGYGLGGIISGLARSVAPLLKPIIKSGTKQVLKHGKPMLKNIGRQAFNAGVKGFTDVLSNKRSLGGAVQEQSRNVSQKIAEIIDDEFDGRPQRKVRRRQSVNKKQIRRRRRIQSRGLPQDILS